MAKYTEYLRLVKPEGNEYYNEERQKKKKELCNLVLKKEKL